MAPDQLYDYLKPASAIYLKDIDTTDRRETTTNQSKA